MTDRGRKAAKLLLAAVMAGAMPAIAASPMAQGKAALDAGDADQALSLLDPIANSGNAEALNLRCRVYYALENWDRAINDCEQAVKNDPQNSVNHMWLGRALGEKAGRVSFLSAYSLGKRVHEEFEKAVALNGRNAEALSDLGEFDYDAPSVVGGGLDKAMAVAQQLDRVDAARGHELRGRIAEERKDLGAAEREYKLALAADPHPASQWVTLASFYRRHGRIAEMDQAIASSEALAAKDKKASVAYYDAAGVLIKANHDAAHAARLLAAYLASPVKSEMAPSFAAHFKLARLLDGMGDKAGARREQQAATSQAHGYRPAQDMKIK